MTLLVSGFEVRLDRSYDADRHLWVLRDGPVVRIGMDALGVETSGDLVQLELLAPGTVLERGDPFGTVEAAKFVGPLETPVSGRVTARNDAAVADPGIVMREPYDAGWLVELEPAQPGAFRELISGDAVTPWFRERLAVYRLKGMIAR